MTKKRKPSAEILVADGADGMRPVVDQRFEEGPCSIEQVVPAIEAKDWMAQVRAEPVFLTVTDTVGRTAGRTDVSLWYVLRGDQKRELAFDRNQFRGVRWFHRDAVPLERADPYMGRFLTKLRVQPFR